MENKENKEIKTVNQYFLTENEVQMLLDDEELLESFFEEMDLF